MSNEDSRLRFEKRFPVPCGVRWNPHFAGVGRYEPENPLLNPGSAEDAFLHQQRWIDWKARERKNNDTNAASQVST